MTEPRSDEAPIEAFDEGTPAADTGAEQAPPGEPPVDPDDKREDFRSHDGEGFFPDPVASPGSVPQLDEGMK